MLLISENLKILDVTNYSLGTIGLNLAVEAARRDPLISRNLETWQYVGIAALAIASVFAVRALSPKMEHTLLFAASLSIILIVFFLSG